jgi:2-C-methyl-D-erythritol 4-phosphate cytidylyltransferase
MIIDAVVVWLDDRDGPDPLSSIGDQPMIARAVRCLLDARLVERVDVLVPAARVRVVESACRGLPIRVLAGVGSDPVRTHVDQRAGLGSGDGAFVTNSDRIVLLHEAVRPLAPPDLANTVVEAVRAGHPAAAPVLPMTDTVKQVDAAGLVVASPDREQLRVAQTPVALRARLVTGPPLRAVARLVESGVNVHCVPGHPLAFPIRTAWDLQLARLLVEPGRSG